MALTATEQLQIISGTIKPPSNTLTDLIQQTATNKAKQLYDGYKLFDAATYPLGAKYVDKTLRISGSVFRQQGAIMQQLLPIVVAILGSTTYTLTQIQAATDMEWEAFVLDQMDEAFEYLADVRKEEKTEYSAIP